MTRQVFDVRLPRPNPLAPLMVGRYYPTFNAWFGIISSNEPVQTNLLYAVYYPVVRKMRVDRIGLDVHTAEAGKNARIGIYNDDGAGYPGTLLIDGGEVELTPAEIRTVTINETLKIGHYWLVFLSNATGTAQVHVNTGLYRGYSPLGHATELNVSPYSTIVKAQAYGALPDPFPAAGTYNDNTYSIGLRLAELLNDYR